MTTVPLPTPRTGLYFPRTWAAVAARLLPGQVCIVRVYGSADQGVLVTNEAEYAAACRHTTLAECYLVAAPEAP